MKMIKLINRVDIARWIMDVFICVMVSREVGIFTTIAICGITAALEAQNILNRAQRMFTTSAADVLERLSRNAPIMTDKELRQRWPGVKTVH